jgi:hypothetical protein
MSQSSGEYLRRRLEASTKVIGPRPTRDAGLLTEQKRFLASGTVAKRSDGQRQMWTSEPVTSKLAGCAICASPTPTTVAVIDCCPPPVDKDPATQAYWGSTKCCPSGTPGLFVEKPCCDGPGTVNTFWANKVPANAPGPFGTVTTGCNCSGR